MSKEIVKLWTGWMTPNLDCVFNFNVLESFSVVTHRFYSFWQANCRPKHIKSAVSGLHWTWDARDFAFFFDVGIV